MNSANGKYSCTYCRTFKQVFCEAESFFGTNKSKSHLVEGLGRNINDWSEIKRSNLSIRNDMIVKLEPENFIIDTLHLRIRILEKLFSLIISSIINYKKDNKNLIIDELNENMKINNISASIYSKIKMEFYIKYKL
jgi:hypothetical protein